MATDKSAVKAYNVAREGMSEQNKSLLPKANLKNIGEIKDVLLNEAYKPVLNEFITNLINRIGLTIVRNKSFNNPLAMFKKGSVPLGTDIQDIYTNPAEAEQYEYSNEAMAQLLRINDPDTHVAYYRRNRQDKYTKTITREGIAGAFVSWEKFNEFIESITNSLYSGNYIDEFKLTKGLVDGAYTNNKVIIQKVDAVVDEPSAKKLVKKCRALFKKLNCPSTEYNAYSKFSGAKGVITTWTEPERICVITTADVLAEMDVEVLASAFNMDKADFMGRIISVDKFDNPEIQAIICDESWLQIYDNTFRFDEFYNASTMSWQEYLHVWQTYAVCPFANAVCLATEIPKVELTSGSYDVGGSISLAVGESKIVTLTTDPSNAGPIEFSSTNPSFASVEKLDERRAIVTGVGSGTATIQAKVTKGNGTTVDLTVNVPA